MRILVWLGHCAFLCAVLAATSVWAASKAPGPLRADEGWVALVVDNTIGAASLRIDGPGLSDGLVKDLTRGRNLRLMRFPAGTYRWSAITRADWWMRGQYTLARSPAFEFRVEAGALNYPGDFVLSPGGPNTAVFYRVNRSLETQLDVEAAQPGLRAGLPWRQDTDTDPFPVFAAQEIAGERAAQLRASADEDAKNLRKTRVDPGFKRQFLDVFANRENDWMELNPTGTLAVFRHQHGDLQVIAVQELASGKRVELVATYGRFYALSWGGERELFIRHGMSAETLIDVRKDDKLRTLSGAGLQIAHLPDGGLDAEKVRYVEFPAGTWLVDALPRDAKRAIVGRQDSTGETHYFAVDKRSASFDTPQFRLEHRLDKALDGEKWTDVVFDRNGELRAAVLYDAQNRRTLALLQHDGSWKRLAPLAEGAYFEPVALGPGGKDLVALSDDARTQVELVRVSLQSGEIEETLLAVAGADLRDAIQRPSDGAVIGALRYRGGEAQPVFLAQGDDARVRQAQAHFPGSKAVVLDDNRAARRSLLLIWSETDRGTLYLHDEAQNSFARLADSYPPLAHSTPMAAKPVTPPTTAGRAGGRLQGLLTLPTGIARPALIVLPPGGSLGDDGRAGYDATTQLWAQQGYAVLRGRYADGDTVLWHAEAAADTEALVDAALAQYALDARRVAVLGAEEGGHAALMMLIRAPQKFHCGIAVAPVTDVPLMFSSSGWMHRPLAAQRMRVQAGDPARELDALKENSPLYQYRRLRQPLLLIHGSEDRRVSFEHSLRLRSLLAADGRAPRWLPLRGTDHRRQRDKDRLAIQVTSEQFLRECFSAEQSAP